MMKKLIVIEDEEEEEDEDFMEEQKRLLELERKKQEEEQNKFSLLCDGCSTSFNLLKSALSDLLDVKDELVDHDLPPSLNISLLTIVSRMFRSITDMDTPLGELTRLVKIFSVPWQKRSEKLKKLHEDYETKKRELDIALRRLRISDERNKQMKNEKMMLHWEKLFVKMTLGSSDGNEWKFRVRNIKKQLAQGVSFSELKEQALTNRENIDTSAAATQPFKMQGSHARKVEGYSIPGYPGNNNDDAYNEEEFEDGRLSYDDSEELNDSELNALMHDDDDAIMPTIQKPECDDKNVGTDDVERGNMETNTDDLLQVVHDLTGIDMTQTTKEEIQTMIDTTTNSNKKIDTSTSPIPCPPEEIQTDGEGHTHQEEVESRVLLEEELEELRRRHDREVDAIREDYERKMGDLLKEVEQLRRVEKEEEFKCEEMTMENTFPVLHNFEDDEPKISVEIKEKPTPITPKKQTRIKTPKKPPSSTPKQGRSEPATPQWGSRLPTDVWERMKLLTQELFERRRKIDDKIRKEIATNIEKKLASQYKLRKPRTSSSTSSVCRVDDVTLPAIFMPTRVNEHRVSRVHSQRHVSRRPHSVLQLPHLPRNKTPDKTTNLNLFEMNRTTSTSAPNIDWLQKITAATSSGKRKTRNTNKT